MTVYIDSTMCDDERRRELYRGAIFMLSPGHSATRLCALAADLIREAFGPMEPLRVHEVVPAEECAQILAALKPRFIHHSKAKEYLAGMLAESGCDLEKTYFDVPRLRTAFPGDYLRSGIAYAFHPHRDTWYSAPFCQINWWMPVFELHSENCMAIHPQYWTMPVKNGSNHYNYHKWNLESRRSAAQHVKSDPRLQPHPEEPIDPEPQLRLVCNVGAAYLFSAAHLHSTVPNTSGVTRYSIDFRTVHLDDVRGRIGAPNMDSECTGTTIGDYLRGKDFTPLPEDAMALYRDGTETEYAQPSPAAGSS